MNLFDNKMMVIAFVFGLVCQVFVTEVPFLITAFGTVGLSFMEWIYILLVCMIPLVFHELFVLLNKFKRKN